ncbi:MaoC family dehydratase [Nakamurella lactea]|uniref:MaoC family dehydratase n=1 Tax=Nakamurella lactea TaxID=459515 RepID=UPI001B7FB1EA|nr:MaoC family dehydratase [Nakamurella lactea]
MDSEIAVGPLNRFLDDFAVGDVHRFPLGRTVNEADNSWFALLTMNTNQLHFNAEFAARTEFGRPLVNSGFSVALVLGMSVSDLSANATANLGWTDIELVAPLFVGDTVYTESLVTGVRPSVSRPGSGVVSVVTRGLNQHGVEFLRFRRTFLVPDRAHRLGVFPDPVVSIGAERCGGSADV